MSTGGSEMRSFFLATVFLLVSSGSVWGSTWRCSQDIISTGDSSAEVLLKCGKPTIAEEGPSITSGSFRKSLRDSRSGDSRSRGRFVEGHVRVEHWYYDRGMHDFIHKLTFIGGVLADIETLNYGGYLRREQEPAAPLAPPAKTDSSGKSESSTSRIDIIGEPAGAKVYLDDFYACNLPCVIEEVEPGSYNLTARQEGYDEWREKILVKRDSTLWLSVYLQQEKAHGPELSNEEVGLQQPKKLYKWMDEEGRVHITDGPPPTSEP